jgi:hypothetical protein
LLPFLNVTSKLAGVDRCFPGGRFRWIGWDSRERTIPITGELRENEQGEIEHFEYRAGRLAIALDADATRDDAQRAADALTGLVDLYGGPWGYQLTLLELPDKLADAHTLFEDDLSNELLQHSFEQAPHMIGMSNGAHIGEEPVAWALDHVDVVVRNAEAGGGLLAALVLLFISQLEFAFFGDEVRHVLGLDEDEDAPQSAVDRVRIEESFLNCFKALESLLGGLPPREERRLRQRMVAAGIDPDETDGFPGRDNETMLARVMRMRETRDKRAAHGGRTGVASRKITFFELMDAQRATGLAIYRSTTAKRDGIGR